MSSSEGWCVGGASSDDVELRMDQCIGTEWLDERVCVYVSACPAVMPCLLFVLVLVSCFVVLSYVQGPCQHIGTSGQCRCTADRGRDGSADAGMVTPGPTAHALCSWECHVGCRLVLFFVRPLLGHCRRVDGVWNHERLDGRGWHWLWVGCFPPAAAGMGRGSTDWVGRRFPTVAGSTFSHMGRMD